MFCPECKCEYLEGFTRCADCDVPLVERLPEENVPREQHAHPSPPLQEQDLVLLKRFPTSHEAQLARGFLASNGIESVVSGEDWLGIRRDRVHRGGVKLFVRNNDLKDAEDLFRKSGISTEIDEIQHRTYENQFDRLDDYGEMPPQEDRFIQQENYRRNTVAFTKFLFFLLILIFIIIIINQFFLE